MAKGTQTFWVLSQLWNINRQMKKKHVDIMNIDQSTHGKTRVIFTKLQMFMKLHETYIKLKQRSI